MQKTPIGTCQRPCSIVRDPSGTPLDRNKNYNEIKFLKVHTYEPQLDQSISGSDKTPTDSEAPLGACVARDPAHEVQSVEWRGCHGSDQKDESPTPPGARGAAPAECPAGSRSGGAEADRGGRAGQCTTVSLHGGAQPRVDLYAYPGWHV